MYGIRIDIYERRSLVLTHIFWGKDRDGAFGILEAHTKTDKFLAAALKDHEWKGIPLKTKWTEYGA